MRSANANSVKQGLCTIPTLPESKRTCRLVNCRSNNGTQAAEAAFLRLSCSELVLGATPHLTPILVYKGLADSQVWYTSTEEQRAKAAPTISQRRCKQKDHLLSTNRTSLLLQNTIARCRSYANCSSPSGAMDRGLTNPARAGMQQR